MNIYDDQTDFVLSSWEAQRRRQRGWGILAGFGLVFLSSMLTLGVLAWVVTRDWG